MSAVTRHTIPAGDDVLELVAPRTLEIVGERRSGERLRRRGWLVRRLLLGADLLGLVSAFVLAHVLVGGVAATDLTEWLSLALMLPAWVVAAKLFGLYDRDEERAGHSTVDDMLGVFSLVTAAVWLVLVGTQLTGVVNPELSKLTMFWALAITFVTLGRGVARATARRSVLYVQNVVIVGAGDVGQLVARKVLQHPEYGIHLVGFVDDHPRDRRVELEDVAMLGPTERLAEIIEVLDVDRVIIAFSEEPDPATVELVRSLRDLDVQIDVVPRLFDVVGPRITHHSIEAFPLIGLLPVRLSRSSRFAKRLIDVVGASLALVLTAPVFLVVAIATKLDSPGPVLFRQRRLGLGMKEFTALKFRTMRVDADQAVHQEYIRATMDAGATVGENGMYKLERPDAVTRVGRILRKTSLDELPQLINVLRGDMSLVGPRPCIRYETEHFSAHHFERFLVPAGLTGLWQVEARARSTFGEALDMDVSYARGWSLGLDLRLLCRTPLQLVRQKGTA